MPKLVVLSEGLTGRSYELKVEKTTIGRLDDNSFALPEQSVSSHHCELLLKGDDVLVKDLNSTNGTFIDNKRIEGSQILPVGSMLRVGNVSFEHEVLTQAEIDQRIDPARLGLDENPREARLARS